MKVRLNKLFFWSIILTIISTQGVLNFIIFDFLGNWEIKKLIHPLSFFLVFILYLFKAIKKFTITFVDVVFISYFLITFFILLFNSDGLQSLYITSREVYFLFVSIFIYHKLDFNEKQWHKILNFLFYILILNTLAIGLTYVLGPEKYMKLITGNYVWGIDEYGFKMSNFSQFWRSPALTGNPASVGYFSVLTYVLMDKNEKFKKKKYFSLIPLFFSFVRSAYLIFVVYEFLKFVTKKKNLKRIGTILKVGIPFLLIIFIYLSQKTILSTASLYHRLRLWGSEMNVNYNLFFGGAIGKVGGGTRDLGGFKATVDSYWLYLILSIGIIGILVAVLFIYSKSEKNNRFLFVLIAFFITGFFINLTQSIVILVLFPLIFIKIKKEERLHNSQIEK